MAGPFLWELSGIDHKKYGFHKENPIYSCGKIPDRKIREGLQKIYDVKGNTYEAAIAMTGALYSFLAVLCIIMKVKFRSGMPG